MNRFFWILQKENRSFRRGFTLVEVTVSLAIFSLVMAAVSEIFASAFTGYQTARTAQKDMEAAQFAMNTLAKELRTSSITNYGASYIKFFDYSREKCVRYEFSSNSLQMKQQTMTDFDTCSTTGISGTVTPMTTGTVSGSFDAIPSTKIPAGSVGKVTISIDVCDRDCGSPDAHHARIQSTSSLRDYGYIGLQ